MAVFKSTPIKKLIFGNEVIVSDSSVITNKTYTTSGESVIIIKDVDLCEINLDSKTTEHVVIKSLTNVNVKSDTLIDEEYSEVELQNGSCVEFRFIGDYWYILSSDGLKNS
jgi:hypothetical protein